MPELPEVETVCRGLLPVLAGRVLVRIVLRRPDLRCPIPDGFGQALTGARVVGLVRRAKYLLMPLARGDQAAETVIWHLGMSGRILVHPPSPAPRPEPGPHDHILIDTEEGLRLVFHDPRRFGLVDLVPAGGDPATHPRLAGLGPEPLDPGFDGPTLLARLAGRRGPIKVALLDQSVVAGLGNIYVCEALFHAGLAPIRPAGGLSEVEGARLAAAIRAVLADAIAAGGTSLRDYRRTDGTLGSFQHRFAVYGRAGEPCPGCHCGAAVAVPTGNGGRARAGAGNGAGAAGHGIQRTVMGGRATYACPHKQR